LVVVVVGMVVVVVGNVMVEVVDVVVVVDGAPVVVAGAADVTHPLRRRKITANPRRMSATLTTGLGNAG
jgi:hypothetical protein